MKPDLIFCEAPYGMGGEGKGRDADIGVLGGLEQRPSEAPNTDCKEKMYLISHHIFYILDCILGPSMVENFRSHKNRTCVRA